MYKTLTTLLVLILLLSYSGTNSQAAETVSICVFYAMDCEDCQRIITEFFPRLFSSYPGELEVRYYEINNPENYDALVGVEEVWGGIQREFPVVAVGDYLLDVEDVEARLGDVLTEYMGKEMPFRSQELLERAEYTLRPRWESQEFVAPDAVSKTVYLAYLYELGCKKCDRAEYRIKYLESEYPELEVRRFDIGLGENKKLAEALGMLTGVPEQRRMSIPAVFTGSDYLLGDDVTDRNLIFLVEKYKGTENVPPWEKAEGYLEQAEAHILRRFRSLELLTILSAGLLDGVNPCAFATLVFFISYLAFVIKKRTDILFVGLSFVIAVFVTYFLIGVGLLSFIQRISLIRVAGRVIYIGTAGIAIIFGILSVHDYLRYSKGDYDKSLLKLPGFLRRRTQEIVRKKMNTDRYVAGAFATGFFVSLLEFACTGQVYLPTIIFVTKIPGLRARGLIYLFIYNICFIIPLVVVFLFAYRGTTAEKLFFVLRGRGKTVKLLTAVMFFCLAGILIFYLF